MPDYPLTAFTATEKNLTRLIKNIDTESFRKEKVPACSFLAKQCFGICCSLQVAITKEEAAVLTKLAAENKSQLRNLGIRLQSDCVLTDKKTQRHYLAKRKRDFFQLNKIIDQLMQNDIFSFKTFMRLQNTCVFTAADGGCALQMLSEKKGLHKWFYKPINCWKYPLSIANGTLSVHTSQNNTLFPCAQDKNVPAYEGLKEELHLLGKILRQDIIGSVAPKKTKPLI